jgi:tetratricopeptide (TPR) repeat protein
MSLFNFTIQAVPVMCLFVFYAAIRGSGAGTNESAPLFSSIPFTELPRNYFAAPAKTFLFCLLLFAIVCFGIFQATLSYDFCQNQKAKALALQGRTAEAIHILKAQTRVFNRSPAYFQTYGAILYNDKKYAEALIKFRQAAALTSDPDLYLLMGHCCYKTGRFSEAQKAYLTAKYIAPCRFAARYALMKLYEKTGDDEQMIATAREIVLLPPKVLSPEVRRYKEEAVMMLYPQRKPAASHLTRL